MNIILTERLYLTADQKRVVKGDSVEAAFLLGDAGKVLTADEAKAYGINTDGKLASAAKVTTPEPVKEKVEDAPKHPKR